MTIFKTFERLLPAFPEAEPHLPPQGFSAFIWACSEGARGALLTMALLSSAIAAFEALLFAALGRMVDLLTVTQPGRLWADQGTSLTVVAVILLASIAAVALQTIVKHQTLAINFPMRLRWKPLRCAA